MVWNAAVREDCHTAQSVCAIWTDQGVCVWGVRISPPLTLPQTRSPSLRGLSPPGCPCVYREDSCSVWGLSQTCVRWVAELKPPRGRPESKQSQSTSPRDSDAEGVSSEGKSLWQLCCFRFTAAPWSFLIWRLQLQTFYRAGWLSNALVSDTFGIESWITVNPVPIWVTQWICFVFYWHFPPHCVSVDVLWIAVLR